MLHSFVEAKLPGGLVYIMFAQVEAAVKAATALNGRWFAGRGITVEYLPPDFYESKFPEAAQGLAIARATLANGQQGA